VLCLNENANYKDWQKFWINFVLQSCIEQIKSVLNQLCPAIHITSSAQDSWTS
jgi:thiaminase